MRDPNDCGDSRPAAGGGICYVVLVFDYECELLIGLWSVWDVRNRYILMVDAKSGAGMQVALRGAVRQVRERDLHRWS